MELEHAFQQPGFIALLQVFIAGSLLAPGLLGNSDVYRRFIAASTTFVVSFGPVAILVYVLYRLSQLS